MLVDGFDEFFMENHGRVLRAVRLLVDRDRAEELTQEAFARACRRWRSVSRMEHPVAWVYVVALNERRGLWRRERDLDMLAAVPSRESDETGAVLTALHVREALRTLSARQRTAVVLRYLADLPISDVADAMNCAEGTVKATLHHALRRLRITLEETDDADR
jgi:RNA polymerase sigma-70 factor (ECF subfamily)